MKKPVIAITMGDPAGIGPEIIAKALANPETYGALHPLVVGDAAVIRRAVELLGYPLQVHTVSSVQQARFEPGVIDVYDLQTLPEGEVEYGKVSAAAGHAAFEAVRETIALAMRGEVDATVTTPINKEAINLAGHHFGGHTEIYAHFTGTKNYAMLLADSHLRVIHVSTHVSLRQACDLVKTERIVAVGKLLHDACLSFGIANPRIGVAGLNPHAGDGGLFGWEEEQEIAPAVATLRTLGIAAEGPVPPDTLFSKAKGGYYDGCVAMYHDQGHIPFKVVGFDWDNTTRTMSRVQGVNITLGLPIIRVSVDHGTAFDVAGKGIASEEALLCSLDYAVKMANNRK